jgi:hypothetical protein
MQIAKMLIMAGAVGLAAQVHASLSFTSSTTGGALPGENYANFDNMALGGASGSAGPGLSVSFAPIAQAVQGTTGTYAMPYVSGNNNQYFGSLYTGSDNTTYLTAGSDGDANYPNSMVTLNFAASQNYLGILWGSVDTYNTLSFYANGTLAGSLTGSDVIADANGNQFAGGTTYVNITGITFNQVIATSTQYAFEFDNVAYGVVPEPTTLISGALLLPFGASTLRILRRRQAA